LFQHRLSNALDRDGDKAIEIDPKYAKGYYRRGVGKYALARHKEAAKDFQIVVRLAPNDKDAKLKLEECQKVVARLAFEKAIASNDVVKRVSDTIDPKSIVVEDSYDGVRMDDGQVTKEFVDDMIERFVAQKKIHKRYAYEVRGRSSPTGSISFFFFFPSPFPPPPVLFFLMGG
jgi:serine/threonine-protein phosphatase 5